MILEFTPLEFETQLLQSAKFKHIIIRIYSVGVWNKMNFEKGYLQGLKLEFTPLEFETNQ